MHSTRGTLSLGLALALICGNVNAEWTAVSLGDYIHTPYADRATIRRNGTMARMSGLYDFSKEDFTPEGKGLYSSVVLREYDCARRQVRLLSSIDFSGHMGAGEAVSTSARVGRWEGIVPGALDEAYWSIACGAK